MIGKGVSFKKKHISIDASLFNVTMKNVFVRDLRIKVYLIIS